MTVLTFDRTVDAVSHTLTANWGSGASITVSYPSGRSVADYGTGGDHRIFTQQVNGLYSRNGDFTISFGASNITITNASGQTVTDGQVLNIELDRAGRDVSDDAAASAAMAEMRVFKVYLGAPAAADADGAVASQAATAAGGLATGINGALAAGGVATFDVPRNVVAAWTGTSVLTVTGTDQYGAVVVESSASGTSLAGKKAFKTVTGVSVSADVTGLTIGTGDVLGLPVFVDSTADLLAEYQDGVAPSAGTLVAGVKTTPTATTGDVRGTYDPNAACDGARVFELLLAVKAGGYKGATQYSG